MTEVRERLQADLQEAQRELQELERRLEQRPEFGLGDGNPRAYSWEMALARKEKTIARIESLRDALGRAHEGAYGNCRQCGVSIDPERLEILPTTTLCAGCARAATAATSSRQ